MVKMFRWTFAGVGLAIAATMTLVAVFGDAPTSRAGSAEDRPPAVSAIPVKVAAVKAKSVRLWEDFSGRLEAVDRVDIRPRVSGAIKSVHFREGALVKAGDLLFTIDPSPYEAIVAQAEAQVALADAKLRHAQTELDRGNRLSDSRTISQSDLDQRQSSVSEALAGLRSSKANLQSARLNLEYSRVTAPVAGRVGRIDVTVGNLVAAGSAATPLTMLVSVDPIYASFDASERLIEMALSELPNGGAVPPIERIPVEASTLEDNDFPLKGSLQLVGNEVSAGTGTIGVRAQFANPTGALIPGQFVRIRMGEASPQQRLLISDRAVGTDQDKKFVYVVDAHNQVLYRPAVLGGLVDGQRVVTSGLAAGEKIVVNGLQHIKPGVLVAPSPEDPATVPSQ